MPQPGRRDAGASTTTVGILGGTGPQGRALAYRFALGGHDVLLGSRSEERATIAAAGMPDAVSGLGNRACAAACDVAIVAVPWAGHRTLLGELREELAGKVVIDGVNPLGFDEYGPFALAVPEGSACQQAQGLLPDSMVVGAFHHLSASLLIDPSIEHLDADVLIVGDDRGATDLVKGLAERIPGVRGIHAGRLRDAHQVEALTANLIAINGRYRAHSSFRVTYL